MFWARLHVYLVKVCSGLQAQILFIYSVSWMHFTNHMQYTGVVLYPKGTHWHNTSQDGTTFHAISPSWQSQNMPLAGNLLICYI